MDNDYYKNEYQNSRRVPSGIGSNNAGPVNILLVAANIIVFIVLSYLGNTEDPEFMLYHGAAFPPMIIEKGAWYTLFTSMFLHFNFSHIVNNMIMLLAAGSYVERGMGSIRYLITYILAGLGGNALSLYFSLRTMDYAVSAGASGAVCAGRGSN